MKKLGETQKASLSAIKLNMGWIGIVFVFLFFFSANAFWGYELFLKTDIVPLVASLLPFTLLVLHFMVTDSRFNNRLFLLAVAMYFVIVIRSGFSLKILLYYGLCVALLMYKDIQNTQKLVKWFYFFAIVCMLGTFFNYMFGDLYKEIILPYFKDSSFYSRMVSWNRWRVAFPGFMSQTAVNAGFLVYGIGFIVCVISVRKKFEVKSVLLMFLLFAALILTNKRAHFLFLFAAFAIVYYFSGERTQKAKRLVMIFLTVCFGIIVLGTLMSSINIGVLRKLSKMLESASTGEDVTSGRTVLYARALELFSDSPLFGIGWGEYKNVAFEFGEYMGFATHNIYLQLLCEVGIVGIIPFVVFFVWAFVSAVKINYFAQSDNEKITARFCLFMQSFFLVYGITGNPLYDIVYYVPYFLICAYTFSILAKYQELTSKQKIFARGIGV